MKKVQRDLFQRSADRLRFAIAEVEAGPSGPDAAAGLNCRGAERARFQAKVNHGVAEKSLLVAGVGEFPSENAKLDRAAL